MDSKFTLHEHYRKRQHSSHWDIRIQSLNKKFAYSFALPKKKLPIKGEKFLAIRTPDHHIGSLKMEGDLENGDTMTIVDTGNCDIVSIKDSFIDIILNGRKIKGHYIFVKVLGNENDWLVIGK